MSSLLPMVLEIVKCLEKIVATNLHMAGIIGLAFWFPQSLPQEAQNFCDRGTGSNSEQYLVTMTSRTLFNLRKVGRTGP